MKLHLTIIALTILTIAGEARSSSLKRVQVLGGGIRDIVPTKVWLEYPNPNKKYHGDSATHQAFLDVSQTHGTKNPSRLAVNGDKMFNLYRIKPGDIVSIVQDGGPTIELGQVSECDNHGSADFNCEFTTKTPLLMNEKTKKHRSYDAGFILATKSVFTRNGPYRKQRPEFEVTSESYSTRKIDLIQGENKITINQDDD